MNSGEGIKVQFIAQKYCLATRKAKRNQEIATIHRFTYLLYEKRFRDNLIICCAGSWTTAEIVRCSHSGRPAFLSGFEMMTMIRVRAKLLRLSTSCVTLGDFTKIWGREKKKIQILWWRWAWNIISAVYVHLALISLAIFCISFGPFASQTEYYGFEILFCVGASWALCFAGFSKITF